LDFKENKSVVIYKIKQEVETSYSLQMIVDLIIPLIPKDDIHYNRLKYYLEKPKLMTYFVLVNQVEEKIKFYDPLYSNTYIRDNADKLSNLSLTIKFETVDRCEVTNTEISWINKGFAKYRHCNGDVDSYEWRKCSVKDSKDYKNLAIINFSCFENKCKNKIF